MKKGFRDDFKYYKRKDIPPDLSNVVNFNTIKNSHQHEKGIVALKCGRSNTDWVKNFGMKDSSEWEVYSFLTKPGLLFIKNPFLPSGQRYWIMRCLKYYTRKPNKLNIDAHNIMQTDEDWWEFCNRRNNAENEGVLEKLRWATFGYHHNWDTKVYSESSKSEFPNDLKSLCKFIASELNFSEFNAEAAIINMYHFGSSLSGHTDHSEVNVSAPLFSFSFGQSAIFLIGGKTIDDEALPILLESGDIIIMSGESRLCYHGVPKVLQNDNQPWNETKDSSENLINEFYLKEVTDQLWDNKSWESFDSYVRKSRINMNVRQVLFPGQESLDS